MAAKTKREGEIYSKMLQKDWNLKCSVKEGPIWIVDRLF